MSRSDTPSPIPLAALSLLACTLAAMASYGHAAERDKYVGREVPARRLSEPPVIDGDLSDPAWEEAAIADTFIDSLTAEPVADQTRVWMGYDSQAIYLAAYCWDPEPDKLVIRETKRDADINDDDHFAFVLDAFHTHDWNDTAIFRVTARGTQSSEIRRGRGGKTEWKGDWRAATRIADDGYTMEMVVPWRILSYPNRDGPTTLGFDVSRKHGRYQRGSGLSDLTQAWLWQNAAHWVGIELPQHGFDQEILILPFLAAGRAKRDDEWTETARGGLDVRYRPTPTLTGVLTLNPDFRNVQSEVEGIDFSRGERWVGESRPFFQEGHRMFQTSSGVGDYFYSRRIEHIDLGAKLYGRLAKRTRLGLLGTYDFADQHDDPWNVYRHDYVASVSQGVGELAAVAATGVWKRGDVETNSVLAYRAEAMLIDKQLTVTGSYGSSSWRRDDGSQQTSDSSSRHRGDLGKVAVDWRDGRLSLGTGWSFVSPDFRAANGFIEFPGRRGLELRAEYGDQWRDRYVRGAWAGLWAGYEERYDTGAGHEDLDGLVDRAFSTLGDRDTNDRFFNDSVGYWMHIDTRSNLAFHHRTRWGHWREEGARTSDADRSTLFSFRMESEDHSRDGWVRYSFGREDDADRHFTSVGASWKREQFAVQYSGSVLRHRERRQQHILGVNYDLTTSMTVGGRLVFHRDERADDNTWNPYVAFRRSGETGIETFLILGDPSGDEFVRRVEGKILLPL